MKQDREVIPLFTSIVLEDPHVIGFLTLLISQKKYDFVIEYSPNWSGRISATMKGEPEEIKKAFRSLEDNEPVGCRDLIDAIKIVRSKIFQAKQLHASQRGAR